MLTKLFCVDTCSYVSSHSSTCLVNISGEEVVLATQPSHITQTEYDCIFHDVHVRHGTLVKTSARCVNNVELVSSMAAEPLTVSFIPPSTSSARVEIIPKSERLVNYAEFDENEIVIQDNLTCIQAQWDGFEDISGVSRYMYTVKYNNRTVLKTADTTTSYNAIELQGLDLKDGDVYTVEVEAVNNGGVHSEPVRARVRADSTKPKLSGMFGGEIVFKALVEINRLNSSSFRDTGIYKNKIPFSYI